MFKSLQDTTLAQVSFWYTHVIIKHHRLKLGYHSPNHKKYLVCAWMEYIMLAEDRLLWLSSKTNWATTYCVLLAIFIPKVILYTFFYFLLIYGGLGSWIEFLWPPVEGVCGLWYGAFWVFSGWGSLYYHRRITQGKETLRSSWYVLVWGLQRWCAGSKWRYQPSIAPAPLTSHKTIHV